MKSIPLSDVFALWTLSSLLAGFIGNSNVKHSDNCLPYGELWLLGILTRLMDRLRDHPRLMHGDMLR